MKFLRAGKCLLSMNRRLNNLITSSTYKINEIPNVSLTEFIFKDLSKFLDKPAITCGISNRMIKYRELKSLTDKLHYSLKKTVGLENGEVVGLVLPNSPEFPVAVHGALDGGLKVTFINPIFTPEEISKQFVNAEVKCMIAMHENKNAINEIAKKLNGYKGTIFLDDKGEWEFKGKSLFDGLEGEIEKAKIDPHDVAVLPYSSGTTGVPKGVMLTHYNCISNLVQMNHPNLLVRNPTTDDYQDILLTVIPFFHIYGFNSIMNYGLEGGSHLISLPKFVPEDYINCLKKYKPTVLVTVPSLILFLATHPAIKSEDMKSVTKVITGAASATRSLIEKFKSKINRDDVTVTQGYGMSETSPVVIITPNDMPDSKTGSTGVLLPLTHARIVSLETGQDLPPNQSGELLLKGPQVMKGYLKNQKATDETIDKDGWIHTGDVVMCDEDRYFYVVDRCKELIKCKGNQVSPTELESIILELDEVADVAVVGIPNERCGEIPRAFVVTKPDKKLDEKMINDIIDSRVAPYKRLLGGIRFIDLIPRNHTGKIIRKNLQTME